VEGKADVATFTCVRVVRGAGGFGRGLGAAVFPIDSGVTAASLSVAGGAGGGAGTEARRAREAAVWLRGGRGAADSGETPVSASGLVFLFIGFRHVWLNAFFIVAAGRKADHRKF
jgi:hypothetical protein